MYQNDNKHKLGITGAAPASAGFNITDPSTNSVPTWCTMGVILPGTVELTPKGIPGNYKLKFETFIGGI